MTESCDLWVFDSRWCSCWHKDQAGSNVANLQHPRPMGSFPRDSSTAFNLEHFSEKKDPVGYFGRNADDNTTTESKEWCLVIAFQKKKKRISSVVSAYFQTLTTGTHEKYYVLLSLFLPTYLSWLAGWVGFLQRIAHRLQHIHFWSSARSLSLSFIQRRPLLGVFSHLW